MQRFLAVPLLFVLLALAARGQSYHVFVGNERSGEISVIEPIARRVVRTFVAGDQPRALHVGPVSGRLYVAVASAAPTAPSAAAESANAPEARGPAGGIAVVDPASGRTLEVLRVGSVAQFAIDEKETLLVATSLDAAKVTLWKLPEGTPLGEMPAGPEPEGVALRPGTAEAYVTAAGSGEVLVLDLNARREMARVMIGGRPRSVAFTSDGRRAFVAAEGRKTITVIDAMARRVAAQIPVKAGAGAPAMALVGSDAQHVFVSTGRGNTVAVLDPATRRTVANIRAGQRPWGLALSPDGLLLYCANGESDDVSVIDTGTLFELGRVRVGSAPRSVVVVVSRRR